MKKLCALGYINHVNHAKEKTNGILTLTKIDNARMKRCGKKKLNKNFKSELENS